MTRLAGRGARAAATALVLLWCAGIWTLSSQSDPEEFVGVRFHLNDKVEHGVAFAVGGFLAAWAASSPVRRLRGLHAAIVFCGLWGALDEVHQSSVPGRDCSALDLVADVAGASIGAAASVRIVLGRRRPSAETMT